MSGSSHRPHSHLPAAAGRCECEEMNDEDTPAPSRAFVPLSTLMAFIAVLTISPSMRAGATSLGPVLDAIETAYGIGQIGSGILSALPCLVFAAVGAPAVPLATRFGLTPTLVGGMLISTIGLALRPYVTGYAAFIALSVAALIGPALANVIVPAWVKLHKAGRAVLLLSVYGTLLPLGGAAGSALSAPIAGADGAQWRTALVIWAPLAALAVAVWAWAQRLTGRDIPPIAAPHGGTRASLLRSPTALALMTMFGLQSFNAYVQFGQLPVILASLGIERATAGAMVAAINLWAMLGGLLIPKVVDTSTHLPLIAGSFGIITASGYLGLLLAPLAAPWLWICLLAIGGFAFPLGIALIPARARTAATTARLSGMVQPGAYLLAAIGPIAVGILLESTGSTTHVLWLLIGVALLMGAIGVRAARPGYVDDDMERG